MKIIKNLKYFLMLGCLSLTTFTFAETTVNQDADKKAVQKQLSKKLNDLSIHIETLENVLKNINEKDFNNMKDRLNGLETTISNLDSKIDDLPDNVNDFNDMKNRLDSLETSVTNLYSEIEKLPDNLENTSDIYVCETNRNVNTSTGEVKWYRKWSDGWIEQGGSVITTSGAQVNFYKPFVDTYYTFTATITGASATNLGLDAYVVVYNKQNSNIYVSAAHNSEGNSAAQSISKRIDWYACGKAASTNE
jgi:tetrahydromethanopterin S-methyltransferase subunit G